MKCLFINVFVTSEFHFIKFNTKHLTYYAGVTYKIRGHAVALATLTIYNKALYCPSITDSKKTTIYYTTITSHVPNIYEV